MPRLRANGTAGILASLVISQYLVAISRARAQEGAEDKKYGQELYFDFRGQPLPGELTLVGNDAGQLVRSEPEGLRITSPAGGLRGPVGVGTRFRIQGDFEVTATVEILRADIPKQGFGVGATLYLQRVDPPTEGTNIGRLMRPKGDKIMWDRRYDPPGEKPKFAGNSQPCSDKLVRLRLQRSGGQLAYLWAVGATGGDFSTLHQSEFGTDEVQQVMLRARTEGPYQIDIRLIDLRVRSGSVQVNAIPPVDVVPQSATHGSRRWLLVALLLALLLTTGFVLVFWFRKRRTAVVHEGNDR